MTNKEEQNNKQNKNILRNILDGSFLTKNFFVKQMPFIFFLAFLAVIYISNRNQSEKILNKINKLQREVRELRSESITIASDLMFISKQSEVNDMVVKKGLGLQEVTEPPKKLIIS